MSLEMVQEIQEILADKEQEANVLGKLLKESEDAFGKLQSDLASNEDDIEDCVICTRLRRRNGRQQSWRRLRRWSINVGKMWYSWKCDRGIIGPCCDGSA